MAENDYTFVLQPGDKTRYNAGPYDENTYSPKYEIQVSLPEHVKNQVETKQFLMGDAGNRIWVWDISNKSSWPAFIAIKKDGELVRKELAKAI